MRSFILVALLGVSLCTLEGEYFIEINPGIEQDFYKMNIGDTVTFEVTAYKREDNSKTLVGLDGERIWWEYNKRLFEKVSSSQNSIRLKAIREGVTQLGATTIIKNNHCRKKINISIIK